MRKLIYLIPSLLACSLPITEQSHVPAQVAAHVRLDSIDFSPTTVYKILTQLKSSTSVGPDGLPNVLLIQCSSALAVPLSHIFEILFKDNILPACWKEAHIIPVHNKKAQLSLTNPRDACKKFARFT